MKKAIVQLMSSNIIYLVIGVFVNLLLPKFLSTDSYALQKVFLFYLSYAGLLSFGYIDGVFIEMGGTSVTSENCRRIAGYTSTFAILQISILFIVAAIGFAVRDLVIILCSVGLFCTNMCNYYKNLCIAVGEYKLYSINTCFEKTVTLAGFLALLFIIQTDNYIFFCMVYILTWGLGLVYFVYKYNKKLGVPCIAKPDRSEGYKLIRLGMPFMLANLSYSLLSGLDRWFVKILMRNEEFAIYSFAVTMEQAVTAFLSPISNALYNRICREREDNSIAQYKEYIYAWSFLVITGAFCVKVLVSAVLPDYIRALDIIFILFLSQVPGFTVSAIYMNIYRAEKKSKLMITQIVSIIIIGIAANAIGYSILQSMAVFAVATLFIRFLWLIICVAANKPTYAGMKCLLYIILNSAAFLLLGHMANPFAGLVSYFVFYCLTTTVLMNNAVMNVVKVLKVQFGKILKR